MPLDRSHTEFPPTQWTLIEALQAADHPQHSEALEILVGNYWPPTYAFLRRTGKAREEAAELTQAFFADVVLQRRLFDSADPQRGRLRALLLTALKRFLRDCHRRQSARGSTITISLEQMKREETIVADDSSCSVEEAFDRRWAVTVFEEALRRCEKHFRTKARSKHWAAFEAHVLRPSIAMSRPRPLAKVAEEVGFDTPEEVAGAVRTVRKRVLTLLRQAAAETAIDQEDQEAEYHLVVSLLK